MPAFGTQRAYTLTVFGALPVSVPNSTIQPSRRSAFGVLSLQSYPAREGRRNRHVVGQVRAVDQRLHAAADRNVGGKLARDGRDRAAVGVADVVLGDGVIRTRQAGLTLGALSALVTLGTVLARQEGLGVRRKPVEREGLRRDVGVGDRLVSNVRAGILLAATAPPMLAVVAIAAATVMTEATLRDLRISCSLSSGHNRRG